MSGSNCCIQISEEAGKVVWYSYLFKNFPVCCDPHKGFGIVNKAEVDVFLELSCFLDDPTNVANFISGSSAFSKSSLNIWKFRVHVLLKPDTSWQIDGETMETVRDFTFLGSKITADGDCSHEIKRHLLLGRKSDQPRQHIEKQRHYFANKGSSSQSYAFSNSHVWM